MAEIDLYTVFRLAFPFTDLGSQLYSTSKRGEPYFMPVILNGVELQNALVSISGKKKIVETELAGSNGRIVNEEIHQGQYEILIRGVITDRENPFPEAAIDQLRELWELQERISLQCAMTDIYLKDDDHVIITGFRNPEMKGVENAQAYELNLKSDKEFELIVE